MSDTPLTSEAEPTAPPPAAAADGAAPHDVAPPEPTEAAMAPPTPAAEEAAPPAPEPTVPEPAAEEAPPEPPNPEPLAPAAHVEEGPDEAAEKTVAEEAAEPSTKHWYVVKVQSGREESIKEAIERRVKIERLEQFFGQIVIPVERVTEMRRGKRVVKERKLYPGYLMAEVELVDPEGHLNDRILYLFRETSGVGDFVGMTMPKGAGEKPRPPLPMSDREVQRMLGPKGAGEEKGGKEVPAKPPVDRGDRVKVRDGTFAGMEGEVKDILETLNHVKVELTIFGRPVPVELEYWQVEPV